MSNPWRNYGRYGTVGIELVVSIFAGYWAGHWADGRWAGGHGWLTAFGALVGVYAGFRQLFRAGAAMMKDAEREERDERDASDARANEEAVRARLARLDFQEKTGQTGGDVNDSDHDSEARADERRRS